jgi:hypothetical protein
VPRTVADRPGHERTPDYVDRERAGSFRHDNASREPEQNTDRVLEKARLLRVPGYQKTLLWKTSRATCLHLSRTCPPKSPAFFDPKCPSDILREQDPLKFAVVPMSPDLQSHTLVTGERTTFTDTWDCKLSACLSLTLRKT